MTQPTILRNSRCPYCNRDFVQYKIEKNVDHVIGRRFVPRGTLENEWNLQLNSCVDCNNQKSMYEDEISIISMIPESSEPKSDACNLKRQEARRKLSGDSFSSRTGKRIEDSSEEINISHTAYGVGFTYNFHAQPQASRQYVLELTTMYLKALFYHRNFEQLGDKKAVSLDDKYIHPITYSRRTDWGNDVLTTVTQHTFDWEYAGGFSTAKEFFKFILKRRIDEELKQPYFWAFEWNQSFRVVGLISTQADAETFMKQIPELQMGEYRNKDGKRVGQREEKSLPSEEDILFRYIDHD